MPVQIDFHSHILPEMDDGAVDTEISLLQLSALWNQGIRTVLATPHFYLHREDADSFFSRRADRSARLSEVCGVSDTPLPEFRLGAEVYLEHDLSDMTGLFSFRMADSDYVMFELPYTGCNSSHVELIFNLCRRNGVKPILAHLDRYLPLLSDNVLNELLSLDDVVIQINNASLTRRLAVKFTKKLINDGFPVIFGSDTHNMTDRAPDFNICNRFLASKIKSEAAITRLIKNQAALLD